MAFGTLFNERFIFLIKVSKNDLVFSFVTKSRALVLLQILDWYDSNASSAYKTL